MRENVDIKGLGCINLTQPESFVAINDLISEYGGATGSRAKMARLSAAALGISWGQNPELYPPIYDVSSGEIIAYGGEMLEWLLRKKVDLPSVYIETRPLFTELWSLMPTEKEVAAKAEYFPEERVDGTGDSENREAVGA